MHLIDLKLLNAYGCWHTACGRIAELFILITRCSIRPCGLWDEYMQKSLNGCTSTIISSSGPVQWFCWFRFWCGVEGYKKWHAQKCFCIIKSFWEDAISLWNCKFFNKNFKIKFYLKNNSFLHNVKSSPMCLLEKFAYYLKHVIRMYDFINCLRVFCGWNHEWDYFLW